MTVLDSSAVLAFLFNEPGAERVRKHLADGVIGTANLCEVLSKFDSIAEAELVSALLATYGVATEPVTRDDARIAASMKRGARHLSLGDRLCLALGRRLDSDVLTADRAWGSQGRVQQIRD